MREQLQAAMTVNSDIQGAKRAIEQKAAKLVRIVMFSRI